MWLLVLIDIVPPSFRREQALVRERTKVLDNPNFPIHDDLKITGGRQRLKSR